jgi:2'-5' RNA ligase
MGQKIRTFVAATISEPVRLAAEGLVAEFRAAGADVKWVDRANMHLTLKFLGDVDAQEIRAVCRAVEASVADVEPFELQIRGAGAFPNVKRPRTVWLGAGQGADAVSALAERVESALAKLGFRKESRRFHPHLTVGRVRRGGPGVSELAELLREHEDRLIGHTTVSEVTTFSSQLDRSGPTYEALGRAKLGAGH